tara:strand:- start:3421 stop:3702 length:282 start_codon:yes stop_codon:yes gene_type:complete
MSTVTLTINKIRPNSGTHWYIFSSAYLQYISENDIEILSQTNSILEITTRIIFPSETVYNTWNNSSIVIDEMAILDEYLTTNGITSTRTEEIR